MKLLILGILFLAALTNAANKKKLSLEERGVNPRDIIVIGGVQYYASDATLTIMEHMRNCNDFGMKLISFHTAVQNQQFKDFLLYYRPALETRYWTSGRRLGSKFTWSGTGTFFTFSDWAEGQPLYSGSEDPCVFFDPNDGWILTGCSAKYRALCEDI